MTAPATPAPANTTPATAALTPPVNGAASTYIIHQFLDNILKIITLVDQ